MLINTLKKILTTFLTCCILSTNAWPEISQSSYISGYKVNQVLVEPIDKISFVFKTKNGISGSISSADIYKIYKPKIIINGGFFKRDTQQPLGILFKDNTLFTSTLYNRSALIQFKNGTFLISNLDFNGTLLVNKNQTIKVDSYNQARLSKQYVIVYNKLWGKIVPFVKDNVIYLVKNNKVVGKRFNSNVADYDFVLQGPKNKLNFKTGDTIHFDYQLSGVDKNQVKMILGGGPLLLENNQVVNNIQKEKFSCRSICYRARRSVVAIKDGKLFLLTISGKVNPTIYETSLVLKKLGFQSAMNLDGGSSTQLVINGITKVYGAPVNNYLIVF